MVKVPRLKDMRVQVALTQEELAERANVSRGTVARLEAGADANLPTVRKLAEALRVEPRALMEQAQ